VWQESLNGDDSARKKVFTPCPKDAFFGTGGEASVQSSVTRSSCKQF
jgi:hypothetical protein